VLGNIENGGILRGNTQTKLYHGEASFLKLYSNETSRNLGNKKINLVVFAKEKDGACYSIEPLTVR